jgi:predicted P-loop ATPase/GTPase
MPRVKKNKEETVVPATEEKTEQQPLEDNSPIAILGTTVTENQIKQYKNQYKKVYFTDFAGQYFIWHRLNRADFTTIYNETESIEDIEQQTTEREKRFCQAAILYPEATELKEMLDTDDILTSRVCDEILYKSGFFKPQTMEL